MHRRVFVNCCWNMFAEVRKMRQSIKNVAQEVQQVNYRIAHMDLVNLCAITAPSEFCKFVCVLPMLLGFFPFQTLYFPLTSLHAHETDTVYIFCTCSSTRWIFIRVLYVELLFLPKTSAMVF